MKKILIILLIIALGYYALKDLGYVSSFTDLQQQLQDAWNSLKDLLGLIEENNI